jgi:hypothetical protein
MTVTRDKDAWLMVDEYARKKSIYGCVLCEKTHRKEQCEYKAKRTVAPPPPPEKKHNTDDDYGGNYSWYD